MGWGIAVGIFVGVIIATTLLSGGELLKNFDFWLNRYQTLAAAAFALSAAFWAARPVYQQLQQMRSQVAVQTYLAARTQTEWLSKQYRLLWDLRKRVSNAVIFEETILKRLSHPGLIKSGVKHMSELSTDLDRFSREFGEFADQVGGDELFHATLDVSQKLLDVRRMVHEAGWKFREYEDESFPNYASSAEWLTVLTEIRTISLRQQCLDFDSAIETLIRLVSSDLHDARKLANRVWGQVENVV